MQKLETAVCLWMALNVYTKKLQLKQVHKYGDLTMYYQHLMERHTDTANMAY